MSSDQIRELMRRYWDGSTTVFEEEAIRRHFEKGEVAEDLEPYRPYFSILSEEQSAGGFSLDFLDDHVEKRAWAGPFLRRISWAAALLACIVTASILYQNRPTSGLVINEEPSVEEAYAMTRDVLALLSEKLNQANASIYELQTLDESAQKIKKSN